MEEMATSEEELHSDTSCNTCGDLKITFNGMERGSTKKKSLAKALKLSPF